MSQEIMRCLGVSVPLVFLFCSKGTEVAFDSAGTVRSELTPLCISEINYNPPAGIAYISDQYEFIEISNAGDLPISLSGVGFTNGIEYVFPANAELGAGEYCVIAADSIAFKSRYGVFPDGVFVGKLSNGGEQVTLSDITGGGTISAIDYGDAAPWPSAPDGDGSTLVPLTYTTIGDDPACWRPSCRCYGSPYAADPGIVVINEVLTHTDSPDTDAVELYNPGDDPVDIGNWFLTDNVTDPMMYRIPAGTIVPAKGYFVVTASSFNADTALATSFAFSEHGDGVFVFADSTGMRSGAYWHGFTFGEIENGISIGRVVSSNGVEQFVPQNNKTLGGLNSDPLVGPVIISEVQYQPVDGISEYVEVKNISDQPVDLYDPANPSNTWNIDGIGFTFPTGITLAAGEIVLVVSDATTESAFRSTFGVPSDVRIFAKSVVMDDKGCMLELTKPEDPYTEFGVTYNPSMIRETVDAAARGWPGLTGDGNALVRVNGRALGNDPANWAVDAGNPGR